MMILPLLKMLTAVLFHLRPFFFPCALENGRTPVPPDLWLRKFPLPACEFAQDSVEQGEGTGCS